jgi:hypothetical protein
MHVSTALLQLTVLLYSAGLVMRCGTTGRNLPEDWKQQQYRMNARVAVLVSSHNIPKVWAVRLPVQHVQLDA